MTHREPWRVSTKNGLDSLQVSRSDLREHRHIRPARRLGGGGPVPGRFTSSPWQKLRGGFLFPNIDRLPSAKDIGGVSAWFVFGGIPTSSPTQPEPWYGTSER